MVKRTEPKPHVILLARPGCHLCEEALAQIMSAGCDSEYSFEEINIESDPALLERYRLKIPVVVINGITAFKFKVSASEFRQRIKRHASK